MKKHQIFSIITIVLLIGILYLWAPKINSSLLKEKTFTKNTKYENGNLESLIHYENGHKHGIEKWYYQNGILQSETEWHEGLKIDSQIFYYENGNPDSYNFYNQFGELIFRRKYKLDNTISHDKGTSTILISEDTLSKIKISDTLSLGVVSATPPNTITKVSLSLVRDSNETIYEKSIIRKEWPTIKLLFSQEGTERILIQSEINDTLRNKKYKDSLTYILNIIDTK